MDGTEGKNIVKLLLLFQNYNFQSMLDVFSADFDGLILLRFNILPSFQVLVTVPLTLLQKNFIQFNPPLPERKLKAIHSLGAGIIEKVLTVNV